ncbi:10219_t:CDS:1, partial [Paraglomus occultum]
MINDISAIDETTRERLKRWKTRLKNLIEIQLPTDYSRPIPPKVVDAVHTLSLPDSTGLA